MRKLYPFSRSRNVNRWKKMMCCAFFSVLLLARGMAQPISFDGTAYTQDFQSITGTSLDPVAVAGSTMLQVSNQPGGGSVSGWYLYQQGGAPRWGRTNGTLGLGAFYSLFDNVGNIALGSQGGDNGVAYWGIVLQNTSGATINKLNISYDAVMNRNPSTNVNGYPMSYRVGSADYFADGYPYSGDGTFNDTAGAWITGVGFATPTGGTGSPGTQAAISPLFKINVATITQTLNNLNWGWGQLLYIRFKETDEPGADATAGIDNFSISKISCTPPTIIAPPDITVAINAREGNYAAGINLGTPIAQADCGIASISVSDGAFSATIGKYNVVWSVVDSGGNVATDIQEVTAIDTLKPTISLQQSHLLNGITGQSSSQSPYLKPSRPGVQFTSVLTAGDTVGGYIMAGIPSGLDAYDNNDGTFTLLVNHEINNTLGNTRAHGSKGAFVSKWIIKKSDFSVVSGSDQMQQLYLWDTTTQTYNPGTYAFDNFRAGYLAEPSSFFNGANGKGTTERIYITGEDKDLEGKAVAHILTGPNAGKSYELPALGKFAWKQLTVLPQNGDQTIIIAADGGTTGQINGHIYYYYGTKTNTGTEIEKAGLTNGKLYAARVSSLSQEDPGYVEDFPYDAGEKVDLGYVQNKTGAQLNAESVSGGATSFVHPGGVVSTDGMNHYFTTSNDINSPARLWAFSNDRIGHFIPLLTGYDPPMSNQLGEQRLWQNLTLDKRNNLTLLEDPGNNARIARVWQYQSGLSPIAYFDSSRFIPGAPNFITQNEGAAGVIDMSHILGEGMYLITAQAHKAAGNSGVVEDGQLLAFFNPYSLNIGSAPDTIKVTLPSGNTSATVNLGAPFNADNVRIVSITNDAPATFTAGTTNVTWTATDLSGNSSSIVQTVIVSGNTGCNATPNGANADRGFIANASGRKNVSAPNGFNNTTGFTGYGDYTSQKVTAEPGRLLAFSITPGYNSSEHPGLYITAFIDWNGDNDFSDAGEFVFAPRYPTSVKTKFTVRVPAGTSPGNKKLRMIVRSDKHAGACDVFTFGEVEDYTVNIAGINARIKDASDDAIDDAGDNFTVYPNPVKDRMVIERSGYDETKARQAPADMILTDMNGKVIMRSKLTNLVQEVRVGNLAAGIYFVTIINKQSKTTQKIVITR